MALLRQVLKDNGIQIGTAIIARMIKAAGYRWRKAKIVLTSNDPTYKEKLAHIRYILSNLQTDEAFFRLANTAHLQSKPNPDAHCLRPVSSRPSLSGKNRVDV